MKKVFASLVVAVALVAGIAPQASAAAQPGQYKPCRQEDGHGQRVCVWDARHMGNGYGDSFVARWYDGAGHYTYITHHRAHRLLGLG